MVKDVKENALISTSLLWVFSDYRLRSVPEKPTNAIERLFEKIVDQDPTLFDSELLAQDLGITVVTKELAASEGGLEALLMPMFNGGFRILIDPEPSPKNNREDIRRFRIGHEIGHTLFYDWQQSPLKNLLKAWVNDPRLERFCDEFSDALIENIPVME
jgi:hypothetical protein